MRNGLGRAKNRERLTAFFAIGETDREGAKLWILNVLPAVIKQGPERFFQNHPRHK
ncbi:MAG: hypothetical protein FWB80_09725 [Defluviitaleaceae bacterium]|nr:hypothetical protein [Defluviitaleaceae bacterium]